MAVLLSRKFSLLLLIVAVFGASMASVASAADDAKKTKTKAKKKKRKKPQGAFSGKIFSGATPSSNTDWRAESATSICK